MNYKMNFISAYYKSIEIGLNPDDSVLPLKNTIPKTKLTDLQVGAVKLLQSMDLNSSVDLAGKCIPVHMMIKEMLKKEFSVESHITIGDRFWHDYVYCEMSYDLIAKELETGGGVEPLKAHVWLTLQDGSILDLTCEAHLDVLMNRGDHPTHECIGYIPASKKITDGYYRPYLVGDEFLKRTGAFGVAVGI